MTKHQKSTILATMMGWSEVKRPRLGWTFHAVIDEEGNYVRHPLNDYATHIGASPRYAVWYRWDLLDFYTPANMALAKRAIEWGYINNKAYRKWLDNYATKILTSEDGIGLALDAMLEMKRD